MDDNTQRLIISTKGKRISLDLTPEGADELFFDMLDLVHNFGAAIKAKPSLAELLRQSQRDQWGIVGDGLQSEGDIELVREEFLLPEVPEEVAEELIEQAKEAGAQKSPEVWRPSSRFGGSRVEHLFGSMQATGSLAGNPRIQPQEKSDYREKKDSAGYWGFVHLKCQHCGALKTTNFKDPATVLYCRECGGETELCDLKLMFVNCECGGRYKYRTNIPPEEAPFDIRCFGCGVPVAIDYDETTNIYQTMTEREKYKL